MRVIKCDRGESESGWLVTATSHIRGRTPKNPSISVSGVDANWFTPANTACTRPPLADGTHSIFPLPAFFQQDDSPATNGGG